MDVFNENNILFLKYLPFISFNRFKIIKKRELIFLFKLLSKPSFMDVRPQWVHRESCEDNGNEQPQNYKLILKN